MFPVRGSTPEPAPNDTEHFTFLGISSSLLAAMFAFAYVCLGGVLQWEEDTTAEQADNHRRAFVLPSKGGRKMPIFLEIYPANLNYSIQSIRKNPTFPSVFH